MKLIKLLKSILLLVVSIPLFIWLESGLSVNTIEDLIKPLIFSLTLVISIFTPYKIFLLFVSVILLIFMVVFYLFWNLDISNFLGSIGFGMLTIYVFSNLPVLLKDGFVKKL